MILLQVEPTHVAARRIVAALDARNAPALYRYMRDKEFLADRVTEKKLAAFLSGPFAKRMAPFRPTKLTVDDEDADFVTVSRTYRAADGRTLGIFLVIRQTPQGPKLTPFTQPLLHTYFNTWKKPGAGGDAWARGATLGGPFLNAIGLKGFTAKVKGVPPRFYTWPEWAKALGP